MKMMSEINGYQLLCSSVLLMLIFWQFYNAYRMKKLKDRCTVLCPAVCIRCERKNFGRSLKQNATYSYEYIDRTLTGNNGVWGPCRLYRNIDQGERTSIYVDPNDLSGGIFDRVAEFEMKGRIGWGIYLTVIIIALHIVSLCV